MSLNLGNISQIVDKTSVGVGNQSYTLPDLNTVLGEDIIILKNEGDGTFTINSFAGQTLEEKSLYLLDGDDSFIAVKKDPQNSDNWTIVSQEQNTFTQQIGGQYLADPNEINGWSITGFTDDTNSADLGNVGAANLSRLSGGLSYPYDVKIKRFRAWHYNNNNAVEGWGWVIARQSKTADSNVVTTTFMLDESFDRGTGQFNIRDYGNTITRLTDITSFENNIIPAGDIIVFGIGAPTAITTNRYVRVLSGYLEFEKM